MHSIQKEALIAALQQQKKCNPAESTMIDMTIKQLKGEPTKPIKTQLKRRWKNVNK